MRARRIFKLFDISNKDYEHHKMRVLDIINKKAPNNIIKQKQLAINMANKITNVDKAYGRYLVADELNSPELAEIFLNQFKKLTYTLTDYRREKILKFLDDDDYTDDEIQ
jgi:hypothetical protein